MQAQSIGGTKGDSFQLKVEVGDPKQGMMQLGVEIKTKPHGASDVNTLGLHDEGVKWLRDCFKWRKKENDQNCFLYVTLTAI